MQRVLKQSLKSGKDTPTRRVSGLEYQFLDGIYIYMCNQIIFFLTITRYTLRKLALPKCI